MSLSLRSCSDTDEHTIRARRHVAVERWDVKRLALILLLLGVSYSQAEAQGTPPGMPVSPRLVNEGLINR
jgi:hypothetical protein